MKIISWNVNGLKSVINNNFKETLKKIDADIICLQETKINKETEELDFDGYYKYFYLSKKNGYSGVAIYSKIKAENVYLGMKLKNEEELDCFNDESRVITIEINDFYIVCVYVPVSNSEIRRQNYRLDFDEKFYNYIEELNNVKDVIICGDFNVCYHNRDICNLDKHKKIKLFTNEEKANFKDLLNLGFIDTYRYLHPSSNKYSYWPNGIEDRINSDWGWRLDYILVSDYLEQNIEHANILSDIRGSDHCPVQLDIMI